MQAQFLVGPIPTAIDGSGSFISSTSSSFLNSLISPAWRWAHHRNRFSPRRKISSVAVASWAAINGDQDHYAVLGVSPNATVPDIKRAYRLLARKYHPDVSKHSQAGELFKSVRQAYEILSNEVTRSQYDQVVRFRGDNGRSYDRKQYYSPEFEDESRFYRWAELRQRMQRKGYWERYDVNQDSVTDSDTETESEQVNMEQERGPFSEVLGFVFISLFLLQTFGSRVSLFFSCVVALFDWKLDAGYKVGYLIAWILGGRGGILLALCLQFASWACGKTSSSMVALVVVAMWVGSNLARHAPLPQGALLTLLYMSIKLQADLK
ncbi:Chaperone DnaJ-domain superfamily protein [Euphorbia peplus]|nr:Chaperone DnaJ-domain superfamily protein [Euphorbia peplus]